jgi:hypothetical protein
MPVNRWRWGIILLAIVVRAVAVLVLQSHTIPRSTYEHGEIAANLLAGRGFAVKFLGADGPTSQQAPLYPYLLASVYAVGGVETPQSLLILELGQAVLGGWLVAEVMALAAGLMPARRWSPLAAGLIAALHPTLVYAATHVQVALWAATSLTATLRAAVDLATSGRARHAVFLGLFLGLLILTDPILGLVAPCAVWVVFRARAPRQAVRLCGIGAVVATLLVAPWIVRNAWVHHELVFVKSTFGYAFWQGNCRWSEGTDKVVRASVEHKLERPADSLRDLNAQLWEARHEAGYIDDIALTRADYALLGSVSEPERSRILFRRALADLRDDPGRYPRLCLRRLRYFFLFDETNPKTRNALYRLSHLGLTAMAFLGILLAPAGIRTRFWPLVVTVGLIGGFHALTIVSARFHIPIEPLLAITAAGLAARFERSTPASDDVEGVGVVNGFRLERLRRHAPASLVTQLHQPICQQSTADHAANTDRPGHVLNHL